MSPNIHYSLFPGQTKKEQILRTRVEIAAVPSFGLPDVEEGELTDFNATSVRASCDATNALPFLFVRDDDNLVIPQERNVERLSQHTIVLANLRRGARI
ncbi:hypothetical protein GYMLUDRAFT_240666 [Collybiopsis luxurians FD-317 M1]|nr:hypothetical protein GYMLUDRAFT_240666 [Collybiopsis luxurians FD-317 M1]